jgi:hypothetical protein
MSAAASIGIFTDNANTYTWNTGGGNTLNGDLVYYSMRQSPLKEIGLWSLFIHGTGSVNLTPKLQFCVDAVNETYNPVVITLDGYTNGNSAKVQLFAPASGFICNLSAWQDEWLYAEGFRIVLDRASDTQVVFTNGVIKAL